MANQQPFGSHGYYGPPQPHPSNGAFAPRGAPAGQAIVPHQPQRPQNFGTFDASISGIPQGPHTPPDAYQRLTDNGIPDPEELFEKYWPFETCGANRTPSTSGVIKISNVPYDVTKNEIVAMLGREARITHYPAMAGSWYGIHILFDRATGKSGEVMVELVTEAEARNVYDSLERYTKRTGKPRMVGNRVTKIELLKQEDLMQTLFPKTKCCTWNGQNPEIRGPAEGETKFNGYLSVEELRQTLTHAQKPGKGQFGKNAPQRPYEALLSILQKYPWHAPDYIYLAERQNLYQVLIEMVKLLLSHIQRDRSNLSGAQFGNKLNQQLLNEIVVTACAHGGFNPVQQWQLVHMTAGDTAVHYVLPRLAQFWPFDALTYKPGVNEKLLEYFAILMQIATLSPSFNSAEEIQANIGACPMGPYMPFGAYILRFEQNKLLLECESMGQLEENAIVRMIRIVMNTAFDEDLPLPNWHVLPNPFAAPQHQMPPQMGMGFPMPMHQQMQLQ